MFIHSPIPIILHGASSMCEAMVPGVTEGARQCLATTRLTVEGREENAEDTRT